MSEWLQAAFLALVQGVTEFLPVSSSAHLIFIPKLFGWQDQGLAFDVVVHLGTLCALLIYFYKDLLNISSKLFWGLVIATVPAGLLGLLLHDFIAFYLRSNLIIAIATLFFGIILGGVYILSKRNKNISSLKLSEIFFIGLAQGLALIPGASRSGVTLTAGLFLGLQAKDAAKLSFLLGIPIIAASGALELRKLALLSDVNWQLLSFAFSIALVSALACIHYFLKLLTKIGMLPFVAYRLLLGLVLIIAVFY